MPKINEVMIDEDQEKERSFQCFSVGIFQNFNDMLTLALGNLDFIGQMRGVNPDIIRRVDIAKEVLRKGSDLNKKIMGQHNFDHPNLEYISVQNLIRTNIILYREKVSCIYSISVKSDDIDHYVKIDREHFSVTFSHLIDNAMEAMPEGGDIKITISSEMKKGKDETYKCYISIGFVDAGHGIDESDLDHLDQPFFSTKNKGFGHGLGLFMTSHFVKNASGFMEIESELGTGTTVKLFLPTAYIPE